MKSTRIRIRSEFAGLLAFATATALAQPGDLVVPLPPDYAQVRNGLPVNQNGTPGGNYCGPTASADLLKWMNQNGWPLVGNWGNGNNAVTNAIANLGVLMGTVANSGTSVVNLQAGIQSTLDAAYPGQFVVGYLGRFSPGAFEQDVGRDFAWLALYLEGGHLIITNVGYYELTSGDRCGGHFVCMTGYDQAGNTLWARYCDPARDNSAVTVTETDYQLMNLEDPNNAITPAFASRWFYNKGGNTCSNNLPRSPVQDGFVYVSGARFFTRPQLTTGYIIMYAAQVQITTTVNTATGGLPTALAMHPFQEELYHSRPTTNSIFKTNLLTNQVSTLSTPAPINQPQRLAFGSDGMLYVLQGAGTTFTLLAIRPDGALAGQQTQANMGAMAYHEKTQRVYWWNTATNQMRVFTSTLAPIGGPLPMPSGPTPVSPAYLAFDPTADIMYYNHNGNSQIFRLNSVTGVAMTPIVDSALIDPAEMAVDNRGHLYVAQSTTTTSPLLEFDRNGVRVTSNSPVASLAASTMLAIARPSRIPLNEPTTDPNELDNTEIVPGDLNGDDRVDSSDLGILLANWMSGAGGDLDGDFDTDSSDLGILLAHWNP
ncbi:MAG: hypothetical protein U1D55_12505 [Phycisphaerae bacterium]